MLYALGLSCPLSPVLLAKSTDAFCLFWSFWFPLPGSTSSDLEAVSAVPSLIEPSHFQLFVIYCCRSNEEMNAHTPLHARLFAV